MDDKTPNLNDPTPMQELSDTLRPAVEQVCAAAPPAEPLERSIDRAQQLGPPLRRRSRRWLGYSAAAGIAAAILVGFGLWPDQPRVSPEQFALNQHPAGKPETKKPASPTFKRVERANPEKKTTDGASNTIHLQGFTNDDNSGDVKNRPAPEDESRPVSDPHAPKDAKPKMNGPQPTGKGGGLGGALPTSGSGSTAGGPAPIPSPRSITPSSDFSVPTTNSPEAKGGEKRRDRIPSNRDRGVPRDMGEARNKSRESGTGMMGMRGGMMGMGGGMMGGMGIMGMRGGMPGQQAVPNSPGEKLKKAKELQCTQVALDDLKQVIRKQELVLNKTTTGKTNTEELAKKRLMDAKDQLKALETRISQLKTQSSGKPEKHEPQVWHRDRGRPTFARVYVGDGNSLELVSLHVSVTIEGPRARTVVDHVFRNPHNQQLEGTFEYPLPSGASPTYFAMFLGQTRDTMPVRFGRRGDNAPLPAEALARLTPAELVKQVNTADWGRLQEARIVSKQKALETYEEVVRGRIDPALLEYAGGNTFRGRVFPIPPKGYNRVILAYEELLPFAQEHMLYRFPLPNCKLNELQFSLQAKAAECLKPSFLPKDAKKEASGGRITFSADVEGQQAGGRGGVRLHAGQCRRASHQRPAGRERSALCLCPLRPALKTVAKDKAFASHAVFLLDTSLSEHPERFAVNMKLLQKILETDSDIKQFNVLTFNVGAAWLEPRASSPTPPPDARRR